MRLAEATERMRSLLDTPSPATLTLYPPFRGVQVRGRATLAPDEGAQVRLAIALRYLGPERGRAYADVTRRPPGFILRLPLAEARAWDLADKLP